MKKILFAILVSMLLFVFGIGTLLNRSLSPYSKARADTVELAKRRTDLVNEKDFYWYNGREAYFTITGTTETNENIIVIVKQDSGEVKVYKENETISKQEAVNAAYAEENFSKILSIQIGIDEDEPVWEIGFKQENNQIGYVLFSLTSGEWIRTIKNI